MTSGPLASVGSSHRSRVLLIDDDPLMKQLVVRLLAHEDDVQVTYISQTGDLAARAVELRPTVVLLDFELPTVRGVEVLGDLLASPALNHTPVIMLSVHDDPEIKAHCLSRGAADYMVKFPHRQEFVARVRSQIEHARRARTTQAELDQLRRRSAGAQPSGPLFAGRYRIDSVLGEGSFATVYRAWHEGLAAAVALKVLRPELVGQGDARAYFRVEGPAAFRVNHPNAVAVYDAGIASGGQPFVVMELVEGETLKAHLAARDRPSIGRACAWLCGAAEALAAAHRVGVLHRDIKPSNLMISAQTELVKVLDFGLAQVAEWGEGEPDLVVGTPAYMAPERVEGRPESGKSDVYALGVVAYELLSGRRPVGQAGDTELAIARRHVDEHPEPLVRLRPDLPPELALMVMSALSKAPEDRPDAAAFAAALRATARE